jgi:DNA-binding NarL/FixJ family response regulator
MAPTALIVDDHDGFRTVARRLLEAAGYDVVGEEADGATGVAAADRLRPDLVLLDVHLPDGLGFEVAAILTGGQRAPVVVLTSTGTADDFGDRIATSGAAGFISKGDLTASTLGVLVPRPGDGARTDPQARR